MDRYSDHYTAEDMEEVGRRLIDTLHANRDCLKGWYRGNCPTEIVTDLINARDEARDALKPFAAVADDYARADASRATHYRDEGCSPGPDRADTHRVSILLGDCRRARTVLQK